METVTESIRSKVWRFIKRIPFTIYVAVIAAFGALAFIARAFFAGKRVGKIEGRSEAEIKHVEGLGEKAKHSAAKAAEAAPENKPAAEEAAKKEAGEIGTELLNRLRIDK